MNLVWSAKFTRAVKRVAGRDKKLLSEIGQTLTQLAADPIHASLRTHKLKGELSGTWSCSVSYDLRILFDFVKTRKPVRLKFFCWRSGHTMKFIEVGTHADLT